MRALLDEFWPNMKHSSIHVSAVDGKLAVLDDDEGGVPISQILHRLIDERGFFYYRTKLKNGDVTDLDWCELNKTAQDDCPDEWIADEKHLDRLRREGKHGAVLNWFDDHF